MYSKKVLENFAALFSKFTAKGGRLDELRTRYERIDRSLERSSDLGAEKQKSLQSARLGRKDKHRALEVPLMSEKVDTLHTKLIDKLLSGYPIFAMAGIKGNPETIRVANMYTALMEQDQEHFAWDTELAEVLLDAVTYNVMAVEVTWSDRARTVMSAQAGKVERKATTTRLSGVKLKHLDPYNLIFDHTVPLHELSTRGVFAGYVERYNYIGLHDLLAELNPEFKIVDNQAAALSGVNAQTLFYVPNLHPLEQDKQQAGETDWSLEFNMGQRPDGALATGQGKFEVVTMYVRVIPHDMGIPQAAGDRETTRAAPFKLIFVGSTLVYLEPVTYAFGGLPIFAAHLRSASRGFGINSFAENLDDMQDASSSMLNASINSMRRAVTDRGLYNPLMISPDDINSPNPVAKIPVRLHGFNANMDSAYKPMPYEDRISQYAMQHMQLASSMADAATGVNRASQGNFTKGNRTMEEFQTVMDNSEGRLHKFALNVERRLFSPLKSAIKLLYMQYVTTQDVISRTLDQTVKVEPMQMLNSEAVFKVADGLNPMSRVMSTDIAAAALNTIAQSPILAQRYDVAGLFAELMMTQQVDVSKYAIQQQQQPPAGAAPPPQQ